MSITNPGPSADFDVSQLLALLSGTDRDAMLAELIARVGDLHELVQLAFDGMRDVYSRALAQGDGGTFRYRVALPDDVVERTVVLDETGCTVAPTGPDPQVTLSMSAVVFLQVSFGVVNGIDAYIDGLLSIEGDLQLAGRMQEWFDRSGLTSSGGAPPDDGAAGPLLVPAAEAAPAPKLPMAAAVSGRRIDIGAHGRPVVLIFQRRGPVETAAKINQAVRARFVGDGQVTVARVVDLAGVPLGFRFIARRRMDAAFETAKGLLFPGLVPEDYIVILPDYGAKARKTYGVGSVEEQPTAVLVDAAGRIRFVATGADAEATIPAALTELVAEG